MSHGKMILHVEWSIFVAVSADAFPNIVQELLLAVNC